MDISGDAIIVVLALLSQTGAGFFWGGRTHQILKDHERRLERLES